MRARTWTVVAWLGGGALAGCWSVAQLGDDDTPAELATGDSVEVIEIIKGDELRVLKEGHKATVRLVGVVTFDEEIDDPEMHRWRQAARDFQEAAVGRKRIVVSLGEPAKDPYGRFLAHAADAEGKDVAATLLADGLAMVYTEYPFAREVEYLATESAARAGRRGLWGSPQPARLARGLREQWAAFRQTRTGTAFADPLLAGAPSAASGPSGPTPEPGAPLAPTPAADPAPAPTKP